MCSKKNISKGKEITSIWLTCICSAGEITDIFWLEGICRGPVVLSTSCLYRGWHQGWIRLLRASPSCVSHTSQDGFNAAFRSLSWCSAHLWRIFSSYQVGISHVVTRVHSLLFFHGSLLRMVNLDLLCSCLLGSGAQQLNLSSRITPAPPASPPASWALPRALPELLCAALVRLLLVLLCELLLEFFQFNLFNSTQTFWAINSSFWGGTEALFFCSVPLWLNPSPFPLFFRNLY